MTVSPHDLNKYIDPNIILASVGISVKQLPPTIAMCPICKEEQLSIYDDLVTGAGYWYYCNKCIFHGDTIELLAAIQKTDDLERVIRETIGRSSFDTDMIPDITSNAIQIYIKDYPGKRKKNEEIWKALIDKDTRTHPDLVARAHKNQLKSTHSTGPYQRFQGLYGSGLKGAIDKLFPTTQGLPEKGFRTSIVLNCQDTPGRTCAFEFIGDEGDRFLKYCLDVKTKKEGGLALLETLQPWQDCVYAMGDPIPALQLQRIFLVDSPVPLPMVIYNDSTMQAWQSICAKKVIFWDSEITWMTFNHARRVQNSFITEKPQPRVRKDTLYHYIKERGVPYIMQMMYNHAMPWREYFCHWLLSFERTAIEVRNSLDKLSFDPLEKNEIMEACPRELRGRMETILDDHTEPPRMSIQTKTVMEQGSCWYLMSHKIGKELISDAVVKITEETYDQSTKELIWDGVVKYKGSIVPFTEKLKQIELNPVGWIREKINSAGLGNPLIQESWSGQIVHMAKYFSQPKFKAVEMRIGVRTSGEIHFPRFSLIGGGVHKDKYMSANEAAPAMGIEPPSRLVFREADKTINPLRAANFACVAIYVSNMMRRIAGGEPFALSIVGEKNSIARIASKAFAESAGMKRFLLEFAAKDCIEAMRRKVADYAYPAYVESSALLNMYPTHVEDDIWITASHIDASALSTTGTWTQLFGPQVSEDKLIQPQFNEVLHYLLDLQVREYKIVSDLPLVFGVLDDYCQWYGKAAGAPEISLPLRDMARTFIYHPLPGDALIDMCCNAQRMGRINIHHVPFKDNIEVLGLLKYRKEAVVIDDKSGLVFIARSGMSVNCVTRWHPNPDIEAVCLDLNARSLLRLQQQANEGIIIDKAYWDKRVKVWYERGKTMPKIQA